MEWRERDGVRWLEADLLGARAVFSTRLGGVSEGPYESLNVAVKSGDEPDRVRENRHRLAAALGRSPADVVMGRQVHGTSLRWHDRHVSLFVHARRRADFGLRRIAHWLVPTSHSTRSYTRTYFCL